MKKILALVAITVVTGCASYPVTAPWTTEQKILGGASVALDVVDYIGTRRNLAEQGGHESNSLIGEHPSAGRLAIIKFTGAAVKLAAADLMPTQWRTKFLYAVDAFQLVIDMHNKQLGFKWSF